jgi:hypothetical protein
VNRGRALRPRSPSRSRRSQRSPSAARPRYRSSPNFQPSPTKCWDQGHPATSTTTRAAESRTSSCFATTRGRTLTRATPLALTTVAFHPETGEIYDADMEVNTSSGASLSSIRPGRRLRLREHRHPRDRALPRHRALRRQPRHDVRALPSRPSRVALGSSQIRRIHGGLTGADGRGPRARRIARAEALSSRVVEASCCQ